MENSLLFSMVRKILFTVPMNSILRVLCFQIQIRRCIWRCLLFQIFPIALYIFKSEFLVWKEIISSFFCWMLMCCPFFVHYGTNGVWRNLWQLVLTNHSIISWISFLLESRRAFYTSALLSASMYVGESEMESAVGKENIWNFSGTLVV